MHLLVDISSHGFGHIAQTAPVVNALAGLLPDLKVTLRTAAPRNLLAQRFHCAFQHIAQASDFGMVMRSAVEVQLEESAAAYREFHRDWNGKVERDAEQIRALAPDLMLANVPYLGLAAAHRAGVRAVGMSSLNWADIYFHYFAGRPEAARIHGEMLEAYNRAHAFLRLQPGMPMADFARIRDSGPIAHRARSRRAELDRRLGLGPGERLVLMAMGGIPFRLSMEKWPRLSGVRWAVPAAWEVRRADTVAIESLGMHFTEAMASCDLLITKPGYGTFAEAGCHGVPVLYLGRKDWPETPCLVEWLQRHGRCLEIPLRALERGDILELWEELLAQPEAAPVEPDGARQAAEYLAGLSA